MSFSLDSFSPDLKSFLTALSSIAKETNSELYLVGGVVRDLILQDKNNFQPKDLDFMLFPDFNDFFAEISKNGVSKEYSANSFKLDIREEYRTAKLYLPKELQEKLGFKLLDFSSSRKEEYPEPGSRPLISSGSVKEDLLRRDFKVNAMALRITPENLDLVDLFSGLKDINSKTLRVLHSKSFIDDPARLIRGARFKARFDFTYDESTEALAAEAVKAEYLKKLTQGRVASELRKALEEKSEFPKIYKELGSLGVFSLLTDKEKWLKSDSPELLKLENYLKDNFSSNTLKKSFYRFQLIWQGSTWPWDKDNSKIVEGLVSVFSKKERAEIIKAREVWSNLNKKG